MIIDSSKKYYFSDALHKNVECFPHLHTHSEIVLTTSGVLTMTAGKKTYKLKAGEALFIPPLEMHSFSSPEDNVCHVIMFSNDLIPFFFNYIKKNQIEDHIFTVSSDIINMINAIIPVPKNDVNPIDAQAILAPLCREALVQCAFSERSIAYEDPLFYALEYMGEHFAENIDLKTVASKVGVHPVTLSKAFSLRAGVSFNFYLKYLRCINATDLIRNENMTFTQIAYESGFGSVRSFNRAFIEIFGVTPSNYKYTSFV
ncbi:MAG: helix-turn-helix domain-containing protein [Clostridia bacterium]|nr:helix-turn-helix domain-containing protein [Clostridia bacterium]